MTNRTYERTHKNAVTRAYVRTVQCADLRKRRAPLYGRRGNCPAKFWPAGMESPHSGVRLSGLFLVRNPGPVKLTEPRLVRRVRRLIRPGLV